MKALVVPGLLFVAACAAPAPPPALDLDRCIALLLRDPGDGAARAAFPVLLKRKDDETLGEMRSHHGTSDLMMEGLYPSHQWIHPFLRACRLMQDGRVDQAEFAFESARTAALTRRPWERDAFDDLRLVIAEESRRRIRELRPPN